MVNVSCDLIQNQTLSTYLANAEMFTLKIDHSLDIEALNLFVSAASLNYEGLIDLNGKRVDPCARKST